MDGISCVLVANRGEIVVRVCRTLRRLGIRSVAVHTPSDARAAHVAAADLAVPVAGYLDAAGLVAAAVAAGADAVHPGYGFLSEDARFARAVLGAGLAWIGPPAEAMEQMGDKIRAKRAVAAAGVPVVPGSDRPGMSDAELVEAAHRVGLPVLLKPAAGGGGKGMRRVTEGEGLLPALAAARREAARAFGDDTLLVERWVARPRHVEVQVFADGRGVVVALGERECSLQRRHQKIVEESPSPLLDEATRRAMAAGAVEVARACGYVGAGTVEFIVSGDRPEDFYFLEMNTRLQVEHPVTEAVTGVDLVEWQLRVATGKPLPVEPGASGPGGCGVARRGHAIEARIYAEDPRRGFLPATGTVLALVEPADLPGVRIDSALREGVEVGTRYDPLLAKVIAWGEDRRQALDRLRAALRSTVVLGVTTNIGYLVALLGHPDVAEGRLDTELVDRTVGTLTAPGPADDEAIVAAACRVVAGLVPEGPVVDPWDLADGWRMGGAAPVELRLRRDGEPIAVSVQGPLHDARVGVGDAAPEPVAARRDGNRLWVRAGGAAAPWWTVVTGDDVWVGREGSAWRFTADRTARDGGARAVATGGRVVSPMPGVVVAAHVAVGEPVTAGQPLVSVEAMKMEHVLVAPTDGVVTEVHVRPGQAVILDEVLAEVAALDGGEVG